MALPEELHEAQQDRVVGLTIGIDQLCEIRRARLRHLGMPPDTNYGLREHVREELDGNLVEVYARLTDEELAGKPQDLEPTALG